MTRPTIGSIYSRSQGKYVSLALFNENQAAAGLSVFGWPPGWSPVGMNFVGTGFTVSASLLAEPFITAALGMDRDGLVSNSYLREMGLAGQQNQSAAPQNPLPGFDKDQLNIINQVIKEGAKILNKKDCQKGLAAAGINVSEVNRIFGLLSARPASDPSSTGYNIFYAEKSTDTQVQEFLQTEKGKGAGGFIYGQDILLRDAFFNSRGGSNITPDASRSLALIHEVVHLAGRGDAFFGGSSKLNDVVIHACWSKLYGHNDLSMVGN